MIELTKGQKKTARLLINKALLRECETFLLQTKRMLNSPKEGKNPHEIYLQLFDKVYSFDKHIAQTYNGMSGSRYFITIYNLYLNDVLTNGDISLFDEEMKNRLITLKHHFNSKE